MSSLTISNHQPLTAKSVADSEAVTAMRLLAAVLHDKQADTRLRCDAAKTILDRSLGKPKQEIEQSITHNNAPKITLEDAARRIAFALNTALLTGKVIDAEFQEVINKLQDKPLI